MGPFSIVHLWTFDWKYVKKIAKRCPTKLINIVLVSDTNLEGKQAGAVPSSFQAWSAKQHISD